MIPLYYIELWDIQCGWHQFDMSIDTEAEGLLRVKALRASHPKDKWRLIQVLDETY